MKKRNIPYIEYLPIIVIGLILFKLLDRIDSIVLMVNYLLSILTPIFWAIGIAFVLNPMMMFFEKKLRINRILSILICYIIVLGAVVTLITFVIPMIVTNVTDLAGNFNEYQRQATDYFNDVIVKSEIYENLDLKEYLNLEKISSYFGDIPALLNNVVDGLVTFVFSFFGATFRILVGFVIGVYLLLDKEKFQVGVKKLIYGFTDIKKADRSILFFKDVNQIFTRYIIGKTIDSIIIGTLCFIGLVILDVRYAALLAIIVGVTNMIPYFGPFIGMIPAIIITLFYSPIKALWVGLFILALQQFDGYILGPKILGDSVGLSPFWIILGILVGGSLMGVLGMLLAVPIVAVVQLVVTRNVEKRLSDKDIIVE